MAVMCSHEPPACRNPGWMAGIIAGDGVLDRQLRVGKRVTIAEHEGFQGLMPVHVLGARQMERAGGVIRFPYPRNGGLVPDRIEGIAREAGCRVVLVKCGSQRSLLRNVRAVSKCQGALPAV